MRKYLALLLLIAGVLATPVSLGWGEQGTTYFSGEAIGVSIMVPFINTATYADTGVLPLSGGQIAATPIFLPAPFTSGFVSQSTTNGGDVEATSTVTVSGTVLPVPISETQIIAGSATAQSFATCDSAYGTSSITSLMVGSTSITPNGAVDQTVNGVFGTIVLNEQIPIPNGITVNAFDLLTPDGVRVIIASAQSSVNCLGFVTGGGWITANGQRGTFGFEAGKDSSAAPNGNLEYHDHGSGMNVKATSVTSYTGSGTSRTFGGYALINGVPGYTYAVTVQANGGVGLDTFSVSIYDSSLALVYGASGTLGSGHIHITT